MLSVRLVSVQYVIAMDDGRCSVNTVVDKNRFTLKIKMFMIVLALKSELYDLNISQLTLCVSLQREKVISHVKLCPHHVFRADEIDFIWMIKLNLDSLI